MIHWHIGEPRHCDGKPRRLRSAGLADLLVGHQRAPESRGDGLERAQAMLERPQCPPHVRLLLQGEAAPSFPGVSVRIAMSGWWTWPPPVASQAAGQTRTLPKTLTP